MNRKILFLIAIAMVCFINIFILLPQKPSLANGTFQPSIKGSIGGLLVCHCPDDKCNCVCHYNE